MKLIMNVYIWAALANYIHEEFGLTGISSTLLPLLQLACGQLFDGGVCNRAWSAEPPVHSRGKQWQQRQGESY